VQAVAARAERRAQLGHRHVALPAALGGQDGPQLAGEVRAGLGLVREQRADAGGHLHGAGQLGVGGARVVVEQPDIAEDDAPMAYRETDPPPVDPGLRGRRDTDGPGRAGDAEALEPGADRRGGPAGEDRAGAHGVQGGRVEVALAVVRPEGDQLEITVLQRRGDAEERRDLVDQLLVVASVFTAHPGILAHFRGPFIHLSEIRGRDA
jgi:hypothetical protein